MTDARREPQTIEELIESWRIHARVAGQYSVESTEPDFGAEAAARAEVYAECADQLAALRASRVPAEPQEFIVCDVCGCRWHHPEQTDCPLCAAQAAWTAVSDRNAAAHAEPPAPSLPESTTEVPAFKAAQGKPECVAAPLAVSSAAGSDSGNLIERMVNRFLAWRLPDDFTPDGGISFTRDFNVGTPYPMKHEPTGTNLFSATQAEAMVRHLLQGDELIRLLAMAREALGDIIRGSVAAPAEPPTPDPLRVWLHTWVETCTRSCNCLDDIREFLKADSENRAAVGASGAPDPCLWTLDDEDGSAYQTACGELFEFTVGTPAENKAKFCQYCGKPLHVAAETPHQKEK